MVKLTSIFLLFICAFSGISQDISNLDEKYGIKKFKLESNYSELQNSLELDIDGTVRYYKYIGGDVTSIFETKVKEIILGYYNNQLYYIGIILDDSSQIYPDIIYDKLKTLFGEGLMQTNYKKGPLTYKFGYAWETEKTYLAFNEQLPNEVQSGKTSIWMISNVLDKKMAEDDF